MPQNAKSKKIYPAMTLERMEVDRKIAQKVMSVVLEEYEMSALEFIAVMEYAKNAGLNQFRL